MPPPVMGKDIPLAGIFDAEHPRYKEATEFRSLYEADAEVKRVVDTARGLEGLKRQWGVHAAGVILSREPLLDVIPIQRREQDGAIITQFDMGACESLGLLKMDFLGLRNLTVLDDCLLNIKANRGVEVVLEDLPLDDAPAYELLARGDTLGVFQLDGGPMRALLRSMRPTGFEDISAVLALYRPGPMGANAHNEYADRKNGRKPVVPIHPELAEPLEDILGETYGLIVYQEQVMAIAQKVAGYSLGNADLLRRAMGKKKKEILDKEYVPFSDGMKENGYSDGAIKTLWDILVPFSDYAFNRAHTAGYGLVSYWTAYLKANYPAEYMAALLTSVKDDKDKSAVYLNECRRRGIKVLPPDVNSSEANFTSVGTDIRFGLTAVRNVGENVVASVVATRKAKGAFADFSDFLRKVDPVACNKKVVESLIKAGAFDSLGHTRRGLMAVFDQAVDSFLAAKKVEATGQFDLFGDSDAGPDELDAGVRGDRARRRVGQDGQARASSGRCSGCTSPTTRCSGSSTCWPRTRRCTVGALHTDQVGDGRRSCWPGSCPSVLRRVNKAGAPWASAVLEDLEGSVEVLFFPQTYAQVAVNVAEDAIVVVKGRVDRREDVAKLIASDLSVPDLSEGPRGPVVVSLQAARCTPPVVERLKEVLATHPGTTEVQLQLVNGDRRTALRVADGFRVAATPALMGDLKALLGPACLAG